MTPRQQAIVYEIIDERIQQDSIHGGPVVDDQHTLAGWILLLAKHTTKAVEDISSFRRQMIRIAALAMAAIESEDRKAGKGEDVGREADLRDKGKGW